MRKPANGTNMTVRVTGHSLGGSIATIFALKLAMMGYNVELVTFGSPRVGNEFFSEITDKALDGRIARFVNPGDFIPTVPFPWMGYKHVGGDKGYDIQTELGLLKIETEKTNKKGESQKFSKNICCFCCPFGGTEEAIVYEKGDLIYANDHCCVKLGKHVGEGAAGGHKMECHMQNLQKIADHKTPGGAPMPNMMERGLAAVDQIIDAVSQ